MKRGEIKKYIMNKSTQPLPLHWEYPRISPNLPSRIMCVVGGLYCVYEDFDISWFLYKMGNHEICWNINHVLGPPTYRHILSLRNVTNKGKWVFVTDLHFVIFSLVYYKGNLVLVIVGGWTEMLGDWEISIYFVISCLV